MNSWERRNGSWANWYINEATGYISLQIIILFYSIYFYNRYPPRCSLDYQNCYTSISEPNSNKNWYLSCPRPKWAEMIRFSIMWDISMKTEYLKWNIVIHNRLRGSARFRKSTVELSAQKAAMHISPSPVLL